MYTSWIFRIADDTRACHAVADTQRLAIMELRSLGQYRAFLERIWGFESAVETRASAQPAVECAVRGARLRAGRLYDDLRMLGATHVDIASLPVVTVDARTPSEALGWLFVVERHVLLAGLIRRHLARTLPGFATASRYLDSHRDGGTRFRELGESLSGCIAGGQARPDAILGAARIAFDAQAQWYSPRTHRLRTPRAA